MSRNRFAQIPFAMLALAVCTSSLHALPATPLLPTPASVALSYQLPGTPSTAVTVSLATAAVAASPANTTFFSIDPTTVPFWLTVGVPSCTTITSPITAPSSAGTPCTFTLQGSSVAASLGAGTYSAVVQADVIGDTPLSISVTLLVKAVSAGLTVTQGTSTLSAETWALGGTQVPFSFTLVSSNQPISYTIAAVTLASTGTTSATGMTIAPASGVAFSWGSTVTVTLSPLVYAKAAAGDVITTSVVVAYGASSTITLPFSLTVTPPVAMITSLYPTATPVDTTALDVVNVVITGTGFVPSGTNQVTNVFANGTQIVTGAGLVVTVINSTTITLAITVGTTGYFSSAGTPLALAVLNPNGATGLSVPTTPAGALANLAVVSVPIIDTITSASAYVESGASATFAPYDFVTIFGTNLCPDCGGSNPTQLTGVPVSPFYRYPLNLSPDGTHYLQVQFNKHSSPGTLVAQGYLVFANDTQINVLVPSTLATVTPTLIGTGTVDVVVSYGTTVPPAAPLSTESSAAYTIGIAASDPGIFTVNSAGVGQGAILNVDYSLNSATNAAVHGTGTAVIYMTGLGAPNSTASDVTSATTLAYPGSCLSVASATTPAVIVGYLGFLNTTTVSPAYTAPSPTWTSLDGATILSTDIVPLHYPPCMSAVTASIAGLTGTVTYAGWVSGSVTGLYQVNVTIPTGAATGTAISVPVSVTIGGKTSQAGVTMWVK